MKLTFESGEKKVVIKKVGNYPEDYNCEIMYYHNERMDWKHAAIADVILEIYIILKEITK